MRVLHVDTALEFRGGQQQLVHLLRARPGDGWAGPPEAPLARVLGPPALALHPGNDPRNLWRLRAPGWDLVATHTPHAHGAALACDRPLVVHRRVDFAPRHPWKYRRADAVIAVSEAVAAVLARAGVGRVHVVHDGVPAIPEGPVADLPFARPLYGAVGALVEHKGHVHAIDAMATTPGTLLIAGEGPLRARLEARIASRGLAGRVHLVGQVVELAGFLRALDVFVHPSLEEGFGQVVIESLGAGCRVVATRAGGVPEGVGDAGLLVAPGDAAALSAAMIAALARPAGEGVARAAHFSVARMVAGTEEVYAGVLDELRTR